MLTYFPVDLSFDQFAIHIDCTVSYEHLILRNADRVTPHNRQLNFLLTHNNVRILALHTYTYVVGVNPVHT